jgi:hypothetical protein
MPTTQACPLPLRLDPDQALLCCPRPSRSFADLSLLISTIRIDKPCQRKSPHRDKSTRGSPGSCSLPTSHDDSTHIWSTDLVKSVLLRVDCFVATTRVPAWLVKSCQCRSDYSCHVYARRQLHSSPPQSILFRQVRSKRVSSHRYRQVRSCLIRSIRQVASHPCGSARLLTSHVASPRPDSSNQAVSCLLVSTSQVTASRLIATSQVTTSPLPADESDPRKSLPYRLLWPIRFQSCRQVRSERATSFQPDKPKRVLPFRFSATTRLVSLPVIALPVRQVISASTQRAATCQVGCASWLCTSLPTTPDKTRLAGFESRLCEPIRLLRS